MWMRKQTRLRRLRRLAEIVREKQAVGTLEMSSFGVHDGDHVPEEDNFCGTRACALGWAALDPAFQAEGLSGVWEESAFGTFWLRVEYRGWFSTPLFFAAGTRFFGLTRNEAAALFSGEFPGEYVPAEIDRLVTKYGG